MKLIAHRGLYIDKKDQNTINAFLNAINDPNFVGFECDIRQTKDKQFIIHHNAFIHDELIKNTNYTDLKLLNIPRLNDILKLNTNKIMLLEIKDVDIDLEKLNNILKKYKDKNIYIMSFYNQVLNKIQNQEHFYKVGSLNYVLNSKSKYPYDFICLLNNLTNEKQIDKYFDLEKEVFIYGLINQSKYNHGKKCFYITDAKS